jgi:putative ABC transport system substrate-binding protein
VKPFSILDFGFTILRFKSKTVALLGLTGSLAAASCPAHGQQPTHLPRIGFLGVSNPSEDSSRIEAFRRGLRELGYIEGQNLIIEYRYANGKLERLPNLAAELVRLEIHAILARGSPAVRAAKNATTSIPIIMAAVSDAVRNGFVVSLARPGGSITGLTSIMPELAGKRLELLREIVPKLSRAAFLAHGGGTGHQLFVKEAEDAGRSLNVLIQPLVIRTPQEFEGAFSAMLRERAEAVVIQPFFIGGLGHGRRIAELAGRNRLPTVADLSQFADEGGLMSYGPDLIEHTRRAAYYVDKILKGAKAAELPVEQPKKFELVISLKTAKQIGLTIPPNVLARADKVIK